MQVIPCLDMRYRWYSVISSWLAPEPGLEAPIWKPALYPLHLLVGQQLHGNCGGREVPYREHQPRVWKRSSPPIGRSNRWVPCPPGVVEEGCFWRIATRCWHRGRRRIFEFSVSVKGGRINCCCGLNHRPEQGSVQLHIPHPRMVEIRAFRNARPEAYLAPGTNEKNPSSTCTAGESSLAMWRFPCRLRRSWPPESPWSA